MSDLQFNYDICYLSILELAVVGGRRPDPFDWLLSVRRHIGQQCLHF